MAHRIDIRLGEFGEDAHHKVRNFIEDAWREVERRGWAEPEDFDGRVTPGAAFGFSFPAAQSHEAVALVEKMIARHFMQTTARFEHVKRARMDG